MEVSHEEKVYSEFKPWEKTMGNYSTIFASCNHKNEIVILSLNTKLEQVGLSNFVSRQTRRKISELKTEGHETGYFSLKNLLAMEIAVPFVM